MPIAAIAAVELGGIEGFVGPLEQRLGRVTRLNLGEAGAGRDAHLRAADQERGLADGPPHVLGPLDNGCGLRAVEDHRELLAAEAGHGIRLAQFGQEHVGQPLEGLVAADMAVLIVEPLEVVDIEHEHGGRPLPLLELGHRESELLVEPPAVGQAGQRVGLGGIRHVGELPLLSLKPQLGVHQPLLRFAVHHQELAHRGGDGGHVPVRDAAELVVDRLDIAAMLLDFDLHIGRDLGQPAEELDGRAHVLRCQCSGRRCCCASRSSF